MSIKIAVGSSNGIVIDQHFGSGKKFYIFELLEEGNSKFIETREAKTEVKDSSSISCRDNGDLGCDSSCHSSGHDESGLIVKINLLSDCQAVLVNQVGKGAEKLLLKNGISAFEAKDSIEKAFKKIYIYYKRTKQLS
jgi:predicted Fe-Mo cluster-binding NifX family protein